MAQLFFLSLSLPTLPAVISAADSASSAGQPPPLTPRIVGGAEAPIGRYSYSASLSKDGTFDTHLCGGSLIAPDLVLTAAHCTGWPGPYSRVDIDQHNLFDTREEHEWFFVRDIRMHPDHVLLPGEYFDDLAIVKLYGKSTNAIVRLNRNSFVPESAGEEMTVVGWGITDDLQKSMVLLEAEVGFVPNDICADIEGKDERTGRTFSYGDRYIKDTTLCAHTPGEGSCLGDSGGPLILRGNRDAGDVQVGAVSFGLECGHETLPGVYARVSSYMGWITDAVCELSSDPPADFGCLPKTEPTDELVKLTVRIKLGQLLPFATGWLLESADGNFVYAYRSPQTSYGEELFDQVVTESVNVPDNNEYRFVIMHRDKSRGFCCGWWGNGFYEVYRGDATSGELLLKGDGDFKTDTREEMFVVGAPPVTPTPDPTPEPPPPPAAPFVSVVLNLEFNSDQVAWGIKTKDTNEYVDYRPSNTFDSKESGSVTEEIHLLPRNRNVNDYVFVIYNVNEWIGTFEVYMGSAGEGGGGRLMFSGDNNFESDLKKNEDYNFQVWEEDYPETVAPTATPEPTPLATSAANNMRDCGLPARVTMFSVAVPFILTLFGSQI